MIRKSPRGRLAEGVTRLLSSADGGLRFANPLYVLRAAWPCSVFHRLTGASSRGSASAIGGAAGRGAFGGRLPLVGGGSGSAPQRF